MKSDDYWCNKMRVFLSSSKFHTSRNVWRRHKVCHDLHLFVLHGSSGSLTSKSVTNVVLNLCIAGLMLFSGTNKLAVSLMCLPFRDESVCVLHLSTILKRLRQFWSHLVPFISRSLFRKQDNKESSAISTENSFAVKVAHISKGGWVS